MAAVAMGFGPVCLAALFAWRSSAAVAVHSARTVHNGKQDPIRNSGSIKKGSKNEATPAKCTFCMCC